MGASGGESRKFVKNRGNYSQSARKKQKGGDVLNLEAHQR